MNTQPRFLRDAEEGEWASNGKPESLPESQAGGERPIIKDFFGENATLTQVHNTYLSQPELFKYAQALDWYIDHLESKLQNNSVHHLIEKAIYDTINQVHYSHIHPDVVEPIEANAWREKWFNDNKKLIESLPHTAGEVVKTDPGELFDSMADLSLGAVKGEHEDLEFISVPAMSREAYFKSIEVLNNNKK